MFIFLLTSLIIHYKYENVSVYLKALSDVFYFVYCQQSIIEENYTHGGDY